MEKRAAGWPIEVDSAGTAGYHIGTLPDARMRSHASRRGYPLNSRARKFNPAVDFDKFDMIIAMDKENLRDLRSMDTGKQYREKLSLMTDYCQKITADEVPDPYYEGPEGFEHVLDILEDACGGLLKKIEHEPR
jgi:protein-tyrosine phosphatase